MTQSSILTPEQRDEFQRRGVLRLEGLLPAAAVGEARGAVQRAFEPMGLWRDGAWRLDAATRPVFPEKGFRSKQIGNKHPEVEALLETPALLAAVDVLLNGRAFDRTRNRRPQVLATLPNADAWSVPTGWHVDFPRLPSGERPGVQLFAFLDRVEPGGGGSVVVAGSHRLLNDGHLRRTGDIRGPLQRLPVFEDLFAEGPDAADGRARWFTEPGAIGDVELQVVELTGAPGDAWLMDLRTLHAVASNAAARPRLMITYRFVRADLIQALPDDSG
jgi:ectoine hydroxylase-related dioxygenase (phytanoyl-CoA dioxygenase family)